MTQQHAPSDLTRELDRLRGADAFDALGVPRDASASEIRTRFLELTRAFHPSRYALSDPATRRAAGEVYLRIKQAYQALHDPARAVRIARGSSAPPAVKPPPAARDEGLAAPTILAHARALVADGQLARARVALERLTAAKPGDATTAAELAYVRALELIRDGRRREARDELRLLLAADPKFGRARQALEQLQWSWVPRWLRR